MSKAFIQKISVFFNPLSVNGCAIWLDGADTSAASMTFSSGSNLSVWKDKSSLANNFSLTSGTTSSVTDGAYKSVNIGTNGIMTSANQITFTTSSAFFTVSKVTTTSSYPATSIAFTNIFSGDYSIRFQLGLLDGTPPRSGNGNDLAAYNYYVNGAFNPNYDSTNYYNVYCIVATVAPTSAGTSFMTVSSAFGSPARGFIGNIAEVIYYPAGVSSQQREQIEGYLAQKWGLTANLPVGHPGRTQTIYTSNYNAKNPGIATTPSPAMTNLPYTNLLSPINLAGAGTCQVWLDGSDSTKITTSSGRVTAIIDKVNSVSFTAIGTDITYSRINSVQSLNFGGSSYLSGGSFAAPTVIYVFIVFLPTLSQNAFRAFVSWRGNIQVGEPMFGYNANGTNSIGFYQSNYGPQSPSFTVTVGTPYIAALSFNNTATSLAMNGAITPTTGTQISPTTGTSPLYICFDPNSYTTVNIGEVIIYNTSAISTTQRQSIEGYLAWKWGLTSSLPSTHPFKSVPPGRPSQVAGIPVQVKMSAIRVVQLQYSGTYTTAGNFFATFTGNGSVTVLSPVTVNYFAIGGGGGGGAGPGGGGGAGGLQMGSMSLSVGTYNIVIGSGGPAHTNGSNTTFGTTLVVALGGGFGADGYPSTETGGSGGCGGGRGSGLAGAPGTGSQGYNGGSMGGIGSGGGGGVGGVGETSPTTSNTGGAGGIGVLYYGTYYGGGGGGAPNHGGGTGFAGAGGLGGGGRGGQNGAPILDPVAGTPNTGGGGGGGRSANQYSGPGAAGGSGVFIISY